MIMDNLERQKQLKDQERHCIRFIVKCDLINSELDEACRGWPATFSAPPDTLFIHVLAVTPHSAGGRKLCAALDTGDILHFRLRWHILKARVAFKDAAGICIHAADVSRQLICPIRAADDNHLISKAAETAQGKLAR